MLAIIKPLYHFIAYYLTNYFFSYIPFRFIRKFWYKSILRMRIGKKSFLDMGAYLMCPWKLQIGTGTHINRNCFLDSRSGIKIGNNVCISHNVSIISTSHDINSKTFAYTSSPVEICDYAFIGANVTILKGVCVNKGAVVCAGSVVTKDVPAFSIVAGVPAKLIGKRVEDLDYKCNPHNYFF